jgi:hypothetical protein
VGNVNLLLEEAKSYEVGYSTTLGAQNNYGLQVAVYNRSETGLTGIRTSRATNDIGSTYDGSAPQYRVVVNGDFLTARGMEASLDRRLSNRYQFTASRVPPRTRRPPTGPMKLPAPKPTASSSSKR